MIKHVFYYCLIAVFLVACGESEQSREYYKSGKLKSKLVIAGENRLKQIEYYENGKVKSEGEISDGYLVGPWSYYNEDGTIKASGDYNEGLKEGSWNYKIDGISQKIDWDRYVNRPLKINIPSGWTVKEHLASFVPLAAFSDSINWEANFNIVVLGRSGKPIDSIIHEVVEKNKEHAVAKVMVVSNVEVNGLKGKEVTQRIFSENKRLIVVQYFLEQSDTIYLLSFFSNENKFVFYKALIKEVAYSFSLI